MNEPDDVVRFRVDLQPVSKRVDVVAGSTVMAAIRLAGVGLTSVCGGQGTCGRCRVVVTGGPVGDPVDADRRVFRAPMDPPSLKDQRGDLDRLAAVLRTAHGVRGVQAGPAVIGQLSEVARRCDWEVVALVHGRELVGVLPPGLTVIGEGEPVGICGSGIVDAVAELRRVGALNGRGRFVAGAPGVSPGRDGLQYVLASAAITGTGQAIAVTQSDVNEIQLAKGAVQAAIIALLDATGTDPGDVEEVLIAGAFGSYLNLGSALDVGLLPRLANARYRQVGNAAGAGVRGVLRWTADRARARRVAAGTGYLELTTLPGFQARFAKAKAKAMAMAMALPVPSPSSQGA
jgi:uncharacterized 2Fe-2S/4Fe-4S cluster protein (DUF4445 family)